MAIGSRMGVAGALVAILATLITIPPPHDKVVFLDVGQGDSALFQHGTEQVLIDGGPGTNILEPLAAEMPWFDKTIEVLILTHPQQDHLEGLVHVVERYNVKLVILPDIPYASQLQKAWLDELIQRHIPYRFSWYGEKLDLGDLKFQVLAPFADELNSIAAKNVNNGSTTVRVDFFDKSFFLSGDAEAPAEHVVVSRVPQELLDVDVLKAGHHGSKTSTTPELLSALTPKLAVISVGLNNQFHHPSPETLAKLNFLPVFRTDHDGSVRFIHENNKWLVQCAKQCE